MLCNKLKCNPKPNDEETSLEDKLRQKMREINKIEDERKNPCANEWEWNSLLPSNINL